MSELWPWATLALLGAYHGLNPGMGWLFAVSLGLQERSRSAVIRAFAPIAIGHFVSIAAVVGLVAALRYSVGPEILRYAGATALITFGIYKFVAPMSHPRWVGMRVGARQLALWSFLMATAHGAGLMVVPVVLKMGPPPAMADTRTSSSATKMQTVSEPKMTTTACHTDAKSGNNRAAAKLSTTPATGKSETVPACHAQIGKMAEGGGGKGTLAALAGVGLHTLAMFLVMAVIALVVYDRVGLRILRTAWVNLDMLWAAALIGAGVLTAIL